MRGTSEIVSATILVAGEQTLEDLGTSGWHGEHRSVTMIVGPVLYRIFKPELTIEHVFSTWEAGGVYLHRLPESLGPGDLQRRRNGSHATTVVSLAALPACTVALAPPRTMGGKPHLVLRVGALSLEIRDQSAYRSTMDAWRQARALVRPEN